MAVSWTTITNAQVAAGAPLTTALVTALRDNVEGVAQRASGAPKIFGVPYNFQEFTTNGTWTKPGNFAAGDVVYIQVVGGGGSGGAGGTTNGGGSGGGGIIRRIEDSTLFGATEAVVVGAGGPAQTGTGNGTAGGNSSFGTSGNENFTYAQGGNFGISAGAGGAAVYVALKNTTIISSARQLGALQGGAGGTPGTGNRDGGNSLYGGGGGSGAEATASKGGLSTFAGRGGTGPTASPADGEAGKFPGGGGSAGRGTGDSGAGANGIVRVWCVKED